ncbi:hypothetical protein K449DRAFT_391170 [Hypoxylon sp. EC38]|nr:hypothetical protein K449DRAFT_391170 [Hypoxylon sp. EC38]
MDSLATNPLAVMATSTLLTTQQAPSAINGACKILELPPELVVAILSLLEDHHILSFSLTCKAALNIFRSALFSEGCIGRINSISFSFGQVGTGLRRDARSPLRCEFLKLLTYDDPHLFICPRCLKLHEHPTGECRSAQHVTALIRDRRHLPHPKGLMTFGSLWPNYAFTFDEARAVVERARYGPGFGLPLSHLSISTDWKLARLGTACSNPQFIHGYIKLDTEAVVINRTLFFHNAQRILLLPEKVIPFLREIAASGDGTMAEAFTFCPHTTHITNTFHPSLIMSWPPLFEKSISGAISSVIKAAQNRVGLLEPAGLDGWDLDKLNLHTDSLAGCTSCTTDYAITVHNHGRAGVELVSESFQDLGNCTDPTDQKWVKCWGGRVQSSYSCTLARRQHNFMVNPNIFPTRPGTSAIKHPSAPSTQDLWDSHEYERAARDKLTGRRTPVGWGSATTFSLDYGFGGV